MKKIELPVVPIDVPQPPYPRLVFLGKGPVSSIKAEVLNEIPYWLCSNGSWAPTTKVDIEGGLYALDIDTKFAELYYPNVVYTAKQESVEYQMREKNMQEASYHFCIDAVVDTSCSTLDLSRAINALKLEMDRRIENE